VARLFKSDLGFDDVPPGFGLLEGCPELFDGQIRSIEKAVAVVPRDRWMSIGLVVGRLTGCDYFSVNCAAWLAQRGVDADDVIAASEGASSNMSDAEECCLRFTRDLTLYSHTIREERIDALREAGYSDGAILDLAYVGGIFNGMTRLVRALEPLSNGACA
jgi:alkylhydroperoxidase family enzyme